MADLSVRTLRRQDLDAVVDVHMDAFRDSAITVFGRESVRRYYLWLLEGPHDAELTGVFVDGRMVGFCAAGIYRGALSGFIRANRAHLVAHLVTHPWLVLSPLVRERMRRAVDVTLRFSRRRARSTPSSEAKERFGILSIATFGSARGSGAAVLLMKDAESRARRQGHRQMVLTVHPSNMRALKFYARLGWTKTNEYTMERQIPTD